MNEIDPSPTNWEKKTLEKLVFDTLKEQKARRRWGIFFKILGFAYLFLLLAVFTGWSATDDKPEAAGSGGKITGVVNLSGIIAADEQNSAEKINAALREAFKDKNTQGIILRANSPGGSPVQSGIIYDEIKRLRQQYPQKKLYAVVEDLCASGCYYVASAADEIYVDKASLIGSIGVLMNGFGFTGAMEKLGIERRLMTAGAHKGLLDPFSPLKPEEEAYAQTLLANIHRQFIDAVTKGRGNRLKITDDTFSGLIWTGEDGIRQGLADALGTVDSVARDVIHAEKTRDFTVKENLAERLAKQFGTEAASGFGKGLVRSLQ
ncbi:MAG: S49 family peptidase [Zoogloeaceae bacterium]|jgi:protease-4|nr:S49 family peptidase [Zoogloeaceae bacterium]